MQEISALFLSEDLSLDKVRVQARVFIWTCHAERFYWKPPSRARAADKLDSVARQWRGSFRMLQASAWDLRAKKWLKHVPPQSSSIDIKWSLGRIKGTDMAWSLPVLSLAYRLTTSLPIQTYNTFNSSAEFWKSWDMIHSEKYWAHTFLCQLFLRPGGAVWGLNG